MEDSVGKILVAATGKGGAGKSTTVACLAVYWHMAGKRVALIDCDPNQTLTRWHAKRSALVWLMVNIGLIQTLSARTVVTLGLIVSANVFAVGVSWSYIRLRLSGQADTNNVTLIR